MVARVLIIAVVDNEHVEESRMPLFNCLSRVNCIR